MRALALSLTAAAVAAVDPWRNWTLPLEERLADLLPRLSLEQMINQTWSVAPGIDSLGIKPYNWRSNCVHGWAESGGAWLKNETWTVFPTPLALGASFNRDIVRGVGGVSSDEGRAL